MGIKKEHNIVRYCTETNHICIYIYMYMWWYMYISLYIKHNKIETYNRSKILIV